MEEEETNNPHKKCEYYAPENDGCMNYYAYNISKQKECLKEYKIKKMREMEKTKHRIFLEITTYTETNITAIQEINQLLVKHNYNITNIYSCKDEDIIRKTKQ